MTPLHVDTGSYRNSSGFVLGTRQADGGSCNTPTSISGFKFQIEHNPPGTAVSPAAATSPPHNFTAAPPLIAKCVGHLAQEAKILKKFSINKSESETRNDVYRECISRPLAPLILKLGTG
jgi:hypothetical protein